MLLEHGLTHNYRRCLWAAAAPLPIHDNPDAQISAGDDGWRGVQRRYRLSGKVGRESAPCGRWQGALSEHPAPGHNLVRYLAHNVPTDAFANEKLFVARSALRSTGRPLLLRGIPCITEDS